MKYLVFLSRLADVFEDFTYFFIYSLFRERGREGEKEGEKHLCARDTLILPLTHP